MVAGRVSDRQFAESKHRYTDPRTGERLISVTSVVGAFDSGDKLGAGAGAAVKLTKAGVDYRQLWNAKRDLGTRVHGYAALWADGKSADVLDTDAPYLDAFAAFCRAKHPEWIESERAVVSSLGYGGRFDLIGYWDGLYWLIDLKCGKPYRAELTLQLAGYRFADGMIIYDETGKATKLDPMPHIDRAAGLYLDEEGKATLVECNADADAFEAFKGLLTVKKWAAGLGRDV